MCRASAQMLTYLQARPSRGSNSGHTGVETPGHPPGSTPTSQSSAALDELSGRYTHPRRLSKSRGMSQQGSGGFLSTASHLFPELAQQESRQSHEDAFAGYNEPTSPFDVHNSFAQPMEEPSSPTHDRSTSLGSLDHGGLPFRLNAMGGKRGVLSKSGDYTAAHLQNGSPEHSPRKHPSERPHHHPEASARLHDAVSADQSAASESSRAPRGGSRVTTPKDSRESQASYNTMMSTDPSSSDVEDSASVPSHLDASRHFSLDGVSNCKPS